MCGACLRDTWIRDCTCLRVMGKGWEMFRVTTSQVREDVWGYVLTIASADAAEYRFH